MRWTGGAAAPSGRTFNRCVLAGTPSLWTLMQLSVRVVIGVGAGARPLPREPRVEARRHEPVRALLTLGCVHRERVGVLVLGMAGVPAHPAPLHGVGGGGLYELLPQLQVLDRAALPLPAARLPVLHPCRHP